MGNTNGTIGRAQSEIMPGQKMFDTLVGHGCQDLTGFIKEKGCPNFPVATGGCGDIWKRKLRVGRKQSIDVAIKVWRFSPDDIDSNDSLKGAMKELYYWSKLEHDNVHKLLGVVMFQGRLGMVSKWMENGNLHKYIREREMIDRYQLCLQVVKSVHYIHEKNMVHGDLKAHNFLVSSEGIVKLADFDHSIIADCSLVFSSRANNRAGGTFRWMAPELVLVRQPKRRSQQTDVYALGMTILEIITGDPPYYGLGDEGIYGILERKEIPTRTVAFEDLKGDRLWPMLCRCWDPEPNIRPTASEILVLMEELQPVEEPFASPSTPGTPTRMGSGSPPTTPPMAEGRRQTTGSSFSKMMGWISPSKTREPSFISAPSGPDPSSGSSRSSSSGPTQNMAGTREALGHATPVNSRSGSAPE